MDGTLGSQSVLSTFIEFFGIALGPQYEMALYELNDDNTGTAVQVEFSLVTDVEKEDPLPEDVVSFLNQSQWHSTTYRTGLTAVLDEHRIANLGLLYLPDAIPGKRYLLVLLWDSSEYLDMVNRLLMISNLDSKLNVSALDLKSLNKDLPIHFVTNRHKRETEKEDSLLDISVAQIDAEIQKVLGLRAKMQSAFTQEVRLEIVSKLYARGFLRSRESSARWHSGSTVRRPRSTGIFRNWRNPPNKMDRHSVEVSSAECRSLIFRWQDTPPAGALPLPRLHWRGAFFLFFRRRGGWRAPQWCCAARPRV